MSKRALWVIQDNLGNAAAFAEMTAKLGALGIAYEAVSVIPFSDELPAIAWDGPVLFYGATGFVERARKSARWRPCAYFDDDRFRFRAWRHGYAGHLLNEGAIETTLADFAAANHAPDELFFVRPDRDLKVFAGEVVSFGEFAAWADRISAGGFTVAGDEPIAVAEPVAIEAEWRVFLVDGRAVASSRYRVRGRLSTSTDVPVEVVVFAEARAAAWSPAPVFVLDVSLADGRLAVVEPNCMHSAGFYAADCGDVLAAVTAFAEQTF